MYGGGHRRRRRCSMPMQSAWRCFRSPARIAERAGVPIVACVLLGTITGSAGGVVRDVLSAEIPQLLRPGSLYATAAILGISTYFVLGATRIGHSIPSLAGIIVIAAVR